MDAVVGPGLRPSHLDWHCLADGARPDVFEMTLSPAREYGLASKTKGLSFLATSRFGKCRPRNTICSEGPQACRLLAR